MKVSIIIPNYNNEKYLEECIESIERQTYNNIEIVIVDDFSTDNSRKIINNLQKKYNNIKVILLQQNKGVSNARNEGLKAASGEYVTFIDSDDYYFDINKIENEMNLIKKWIKKGRDIVAYSQTISVTIEGKELFKPSIKKYKHSNGSVITDFISEFRSTNIPRDYCVKKSVIEGVGAYCYNEDFYEDLDLLMRLAKDFKFYSTLSNGTAHRITGQGLSSRCEGDHIRAKEKICNHYYKQLDVCSKIIVQAKKIVWSIYTRVK